jgi:hypothetical protein
LIATATRLIATATRLIATATRLIATASGMIAASIGWIALIAPLVASAPISIPAATGAGHTTRAPVLFGIHHAGDAPRPFIAGVAPNVNCRPHDSHGSRVR